MSGCWDRTEINDIAFVEATGIDKAGDEYTLAAQFPLPGQMGGAGSVGGGGGTSGAKMWFLDSAKGPSLKEIIDRQQKSLSRQLNFSHRRVLIVGEQLAKSGVSSILDIVSRIPQNRLTSNLVVSKGDALELLNAKSSLEKIPAEMARELLVNSMKQPRTIKHVIDEILADGKEPVLPYFILDRTRPGKEGKPETIIRIDGLALFKGDRLVSFVRGEEAQGILWAMNQNKNPSLSVDAPRGKGKISIQFAENHVSIKPVAQNDEMTMKIEITARGGVVENESNYNNSTDNSMAVQHALTKKLQTMVENSIRRLQTEHRCDSIGFGDAIYRRYPAYWQRIKDDWDQIYPNVKMNITVRIDIENTGTVIKPIAKKEDEIVND